MFNSENDNFRLKAREATP